MQEELVRSYQHIQDFTHKFIDSRHTPHRALKAAYSDCRAQIESAVDKNENLKKILSTKNEQSLLLRESIINYTLITISNHAVSSEIDSYKPTFKGGK